MLPLSLSNLREPGKRLLLLSLPDVPSHRGHLRRISASIFGESRALQDTALPHAPPKYTPATLQLSLSQCHPNDPNSPHEPARTAFRARSPKRPNPHPPSASVPAHAPVAEGSSTVMALTPCKVRHHPIPSRLIPCIINTLFSQPATRFPDPALAATNPAPSPYAKSASTNEQPTSSFSNSPSRVSCAKSP